MSERVWGDFSKERASSRARAVRATLEVLEKRAEHFGIAERVALRELERRRLAVAAVAEGSDRGPELVQHARDALCERGD